MKSDHWTEISQYLIYPESFNPRQPQIHTELHVHAFISVKFSFFLNFSSSFDLNLWKSWFNHDKVRQAEIIVYFIYISQSRNWTTLYIGK